MNPAKAPLWLQRVITLAPRPRGIHLISQEIFSHCPECAELEVGLLHLFIQHTSASLSLGENASADVRRDMESYLNRSVPEDYPYEHSLEGSDDMPAHIKAALLGHALSIPIFQGKPRLGTWQGIYLCEHRNRAAARTLVLTLQGQLQL